MTCSLSPLRCPVCNEPFEQTERAFHCTNRHAFDLAKEGYLNLLLSHQRRSNTPGDDKAMVQARRRFFDSGIYDPLMERLQTIVSQHDSPAAILDCGCGEGHLSGSLPGRIFGTDISKEAVRLAAKRYKRANWIVANIMRSLPFADRSMDLILSILAPRNPKEFARILKPTGSLILGVPGPNHLIELRSQLQANAEDFEEKADEAVEKCAPYFEEKDRSLLCCETVLNQQQIADLIQMTPIFWNSVPEAKEQIGTLNELKITIRFALITLTPT